jgi:hypothetical protein
MVCAGEVFAFKPFPLHLACLAGTMWRYWSPTWLAYLLVRVERAWNKNAIRVLMAALPRDLSLSGFFDEGLPWILGYGPSSDGRPG